MSICYSKQKKYDEALKVINECIKNNPEYAKALIKRGELNTQLENFDEAVRDYSLASDIDATGFDVQNKLKQA